MSKHERKQLRWVKQVQVPPLASRSAAAPVAVEPTTRERLIAALADRPQTVAQLAEDFGFSQPTVLDHVRRALRDGLIVEVQIAPAERRSAAERYYAPTVPVIRAPDRELLESACRALAKDMADALSRHQGDLQAAFAMTSLAREGWAFADLWPYFHETLRRLALRHGGGMPPPTRLAPHGLAWVEEAIETETGIELSEREEETA